MKSECDWEQQGLVSLWRYADDECIAPGWHLTADPLGALSLISLFRMLEKGTIGASHTVALTPPSSSALRVADNRGGGADVVAPDQWRITHADSGASGGTWQFPANAGDASLLVGGRYTAQVIAGLEGIARSQDESSAGSSADESSVLWFWRLPRST
jgi:hypothetical protein